MSTKSTSTELSYTHPPSEFLDATGDAKVSGSKVLQVLSRLRRTSLLGTAFLRLFRTLQAVGVSVVPNHFYWPIPDLRILEQQDWPIRNSTFDLNLDDQAEFAQRVMKRYSSELRFQDKASDPTMYHRNNGFFESVDAEIAYCMVRDRKPQRIVEVGGGFSTRVMAAAVRANTAEGSPCQLTTIEPNPDTTLRRGFAGLSGLITKRVQEVPLELFISLKPGDMLFIDSSHVVTVGSDVVHEFFEIFPRLQPGVIVHLHDIFYPSDYPREAVLKCLWFWSEQYLLEALLTSNSGFEVLWASSAMYLLSPKVLTESFPSWDYSYSKMPTKVRQFVPTADGRRVWPSSFWMRKLASTTGKVSPS